MLAGDMPIHTILVSLEMEMDHQKETVISLRVFQKF